MKFRVLRQHSGDRDYLPGETREARLEDVRHLIPNVLEPEKASPPVIGEKSDARPILNKAMPAPPNKTEAPKSSPKAK